MMSWGRMVGATGIEPVTPTMSKYGLTCSHLRYQVLSGNSARSDFFVIHRFDRPACEVRANGFSAGSPLVVRSC